MKAWLEAYLENGKHDAVHDRVEIDFRPGDAPCLVELDGKEFKRVLENLFSNTVKYRTQPRSRVLLSLNRMQNGRFVTLLYKDDGPGVPDDSLSRIFDSFYRVDRARSSSGNGSGIGLAVAKEIILGHKGKIWAENRGGLAVIIQIPCFEEDEDGEDSDCGRR